MKTLSARTIVAVALAACALGTATARDSGLDGVDRNRIYAEASRAGVEMTDVWIKVESYRRSVTLGGAIPTTNDAFTLFAVVASIAADTQRISNVLQSVTCANGKNPFPSTFTAGFVPTAKKETKAVLADTSQEFVDDSIALFVRLAQSLSADLISNSLARAEASGDDTPAISIDQIRWPPVSPVRETTDEPKRAIRYEQPGDRIYDTPAEPPAE